MAAKCRSGVSSDRAFTAVPLAVPRSRKLIPEFRLHRPRIAGEAVAMKAGLRLAQIPFTRERVLAAIEAAR
jgi:hypothetical protein